MSRWTSPDELLERFGALTAFLRSTRSLWEHRPFMALPCPWEPEYPELARWLRQLNAEQIDALELHSDHFHDDAPAAFARIDAEGRTLSELPSLVSPADSHPVDAHPHLHYGVRARKWKQIQAFVGVAAPLVSDARPEYVLDWCAGKGHLGRTLAHQVGTRAVLLERNEALRADAEKFARHLGVPIEFRRDDALGPTARESLSAGAGAVALHACGVLGDTLWRHAIDCGAAAVATALCCYHNLGGAEDYAPRSRAGRGADLPLTAKLLRLASADEIVARPAIRESRRRELAWRLGFDLLVREATGQDRYTPLGPVPKGWLDLPFSECVSRLAAEHGVPLPARWEPTRAEAHGWERARLARALGVVRCLFRRPLEVWLALDRALAIADSGRPVAIGTFCDRFTTPRNVMLVSVV